MQDFTVETRNFAEEKLNLSETLRILRVLAEKKTISNLGEIL